LAEEEHSQLLCNCRTSGANRRVLVHLLASRFTDDGFDEERNLWNGTASWKVVEEDIEEVLP
jgi:hypothetical protein